MINYEEGSRSRQSTMAAVSNDQSGSYLQLAPLTIFPDEVRLEQCLLLIRDNPGGLLQHLTYSKEQLDIL